MFAPFAVVSLLIPLVMLAGVAWLVVWTTRRRRAAALERAAQVAAVGWALVPPNPWLLQVAGNLFPASGDPGMTYAGEFRGRGLCVFDYTYVTNNGKSQQRHTVHVVALSLPVSLPPFTLMHESGLRRVFMGRDLELENQQFNDRFRIECHDDRYASAVMHPRMMECVQHNPGLEWQIAGNALVSWGRGSFAVPDVLARSEAMSQLIDLIPPFVLRDYGQPTFR
ncbi:hypothetical protein [Kribbella kalugense]|uniref:DUF3137 domain-containing protein n=1 Tax=Kribbella kalugense TaxID=2512221 RepID=A0A4R7ZEJ2_9ACTN|nr:hypothetical protein [Kribbella kalugense]TDW15682.1 hypothetical protein EV650_7172 [Kribbella kalugense]